MSTEPSDERIQQSPETGTARRSAAWSADRGIPDLRAADDHGEEIRSLLSAGVRGGAILGVVLGLALGMESRSAVGLVLGILLGTLGMAVASLLGLLIFLGMFFVCEWAVLWYMAASAPSFPPRLVERARWQEESDASDTTFRERPSRR